MLVINFKKQFAPAVESGEKRQTIRALRKDGKRAKPGDHLRLYTGMRTSACRKLMDATCTSVASIQIYDEYPQITIVVNGKKLSFDEGIALAKSDGFDTRAEFIGFFQETHRFPFEGLITSWEPMP